jgi:hypothetical protein
MDTQISYKITGLTPLLFNRRSMMMEDGEEFKQKKGEETSAFDLRIWPEKAHANPDGTLFIPDTWIRQALIDTQKATRHAIKPPAMKGVKQRADATMKPYFISGLSIENSPLMTMGTTQAANKCLRPATKADLRAMKQMCRIPSTGGVIPVIRPMLPVWSATVSITITDEVINEPVIRECLEWVGRYSGMGDWRPQNGGSYGKFQVS